MALFSRRFWNSVIRLDRRVAAADANCTSAVERFQVSRVVVSNDARAEFHLELCEALAELRAAISELRQFQERNLADPKE
jgi:hypothetical protein